MYKLYKNYKKDKNKYQLDLKVKKKYKIKKKINKILVLVN